MRTLRYISGPGHGWLEVQQDLIREVGVAANISSYSYMLKNRDGSGAIAFLEEDCDMPAFLYAARIAGIEFTIVDEYDPDEVVRNYPPFRPSAFGEPRRSTVPNSTLSS